MARRRDKRAEAIGARLECPACAYSLKGIDGAVVRCPECGLTIDRAAMVTARWRGSWYAVPGFSRLLLPVAWLAFASLPALFVVQMQGALAAALVVVGVTAAGWIGLLLLIRNDLQSGQAVVLALFAHVLFVGYGAALYLCLWGVVSAMAWQRPLVLVAIVPGLAVIWLCRRGERSIAGACVRQYLIGAMPDSARAALPRYDAGDEPRRRPDADA